MVLVFAAALSMQAFGQGDTSYWKRSASFGLNFSNVSLENWAGGGENQVSVAGLISASADYKKDKFSWNNYLEVGYGLVRTDAVDEFRKSDDRFIFTSKAAYQIKESKYNFTALLDFRTQMDDGFNYEIDDSTNLEVETLISRLMAPGFLTFAIGAEYKPNDNFFFMLSPISSKLTFVLDQGLADLGAFGVEPGENLLVQYGWTMSSRYFANVAKNVTYETKLNLFGDYETPDVIDVNWENNLVLKVNDWLSSTVSLQVVYDQDVIDRTQLKNVIAVGFLLKK